MKKEAMGKTQKALAKLYFALGETETQKPENAGISSSAIECLAYLAIRNTGESTGLKYFAMGAASANRQKLKPQGGKASRAFPATSCKPPRGKKQEKKGKPEYFKGEREIGSCPFCGTSEKNFTKKKNKDFKGFIKNTCPCGKYAFDKAEEE